MSFIYYLQRQPIFPEKKEKVQRTNLYFIVSIYTLTHFTYVSSVLIVATGQWMESQSVQ